MARCTAGFLVGFCELRAVRAVGDMAIFAGGGFQMERRPASIGFVAGPAGRGLMGAGQFEGRFPVVPVEIVVRRRPGFLAVAILAYRPTRRFAQLALVEIDMAR
jgi:hypothetical protein